MHQTGNRTTGAKGRLRLRGLIRNAESVGFCLEQPFK